MSHIIRHTKRELCTAGKTYDMSYIIRYTVVYTADKSSMQEYGRQQTRYVVPQYKEHLQKSAEIIGSFRPPHVSGVKHRRPKPRVYAHPRVQGQPKPHVVSRWVVRPCREARGVMREPSSQQGRGPGGGGCMCVCLCVLCVCVDFRFTLSILPGGAFQHSMLERPKMQGRAQTTTVVSYH